MFSSNLPNIGGLDDALIRPGRCFARVQTRELTLEEAERLWRRFPPDEHRAADAVVLAAKASGRRTLSLAEVYQAAHDAHQGLRSLGIAA